MNIYCMQTVSGNGPAGRARFWRLCKVSVLFFSLMVGSGFVMAQQKSAVPKRMTFLGGHRNDTVNVRTAKLLLSMPLQITDAQKGTYSIESYRFGYRRKGFAIEDGKAKPNTTLQSALFSQSPLPDIWIRNVGENLRSGDELLFFDILVRDKNGQRYLAPDIKISVQ